MVNTNVMAALTFALIILSIRTSLSLIYASRVKLGFLGFYCEFPLFYCSQLNHFSLTSSQIKGDSSAMLTLLVKHIIYPTLPLDPLCVPFVPFFFNI